MSDASTSQHYPQFAGETSDEYFVRLFSNKEEYGLTCEQIADMLNLSYGVSLGESVYRKRWRLYTKAFEYARNHFASDRFAAEARELEKQRIRLQDERTAYRRMLREEARTDALFDILKANFSAYDGIEQFVVDKDCGDTDDTLVICVSDLHIGIDFKNKVGTFNVDVAKERMEHYAQEVVRFAQTHKPKNCEVVLLGDLISGMIHTGLRIENKESVVEQLKIACEVMSQFLLTISQYFETVKVRGIGGNHSRVTDYDSVRLDEMLDALVPFYLEARLSAIKNIHVITSSNSTGMEHMYIGNAHILIVHGEFDKMDEAGVAKLQGVAGVCDTIIAGHLHHAMFKDIMGVHVIQSGTLLDSADQFCLKNRLSGAPSQMMALFSGDGELKEVIPVYF